MKQIRRNDVSKNDIVNNSLKKIENINKTHMVKLAYSKFEIKIYIARWTTCRIQTKQDQLWAVAKIQ